MKQPVQAVGGAYERYLVLLKQLLDLIERGEDDERGDALRDRMDLEWQQLTNEERGFIEERSDP